MKIFIQAVILLMSLQANALDYLPRYFVVDQADVPEEGWYWDPDQSGWGLNMTIQPASFTESGYYVQGAIYTYDENGTAFYYTFQNPYVPNTDVFAWREGRGLMGSFNSLLAESEGGNCLVCSHQQSSIAASDLGEVTIEWESPIKAVMRVGNRVIDIEHFYFQDGLRNPTADFLTEGLWSVNGLSTGYSFTPANPPFRPNDELSWGFSAYKGITSFESIPKEEFLELTIYGIDEIQSDLANLKWFRSVKKSLGTKPLYRYSDIRDWTSPMTENDVLYSNDNVAYDGLYSSMLYVAYDIENSILYAFVGDGGFSGGAGLPAYNGSISICNNNGVPSYFTSSYKPAVAASFKFYYPGDVLDYIDCGAPDFDMPLELKRQKTLSMTRIANDDMKEIGFFTRH